MSEGMIIRDPDEMDKFADDVELYCEEMRNACSALKDSLSLASNGMKDRVSHKALERVDQLVDELISDLPEVEGTVGILHNAAKPLKLARTLM